MAPTIDRAKENREKQWVKTDFIVLPFFFSNFQKFGWLAQMARMARWLAHWQYPGVSVSSVSWSGDGCFWVTSSWSKVFPESMLAFILFSRAMRELESCSVNFSVELSLSTSEVSILLWKTEKGGKTHSGAKGLLTKTGKSLPLEIPRKLSNRKRIQPV